MMEPVERRRDNRQDIQLHVEFAPATEHGTPVMLSGVTCNVSPGGVYFHTEKAGSLRAEAEVAIRIAIPRPEEAPGAPLALAGKARVKRIDEIHAQGRQDGAIWGVAVKFDERPSIRTGFDFWMLDND